MLFKVSQKAATGENPLAFTYNGGTYQITLDADGDPAGVVDQPGKFCSFKVKGAHLERIASPDFVKAVEAAAENAVKARKAGRLVLKDRGEYKVWVVKD